jgi:hypothetical protein
MRTGSLSVLLAIVLWLGNAAAPLGVHARREDRYSYPYSRVWTTAVRLVRVDLDCAITEKDREEGYFFFDYKDGNKTYPGSVELVATKEDGVETVRVVVQVPALPSYVEALVLDRLGRRLLADFGTPKQPEPKPAPEKKKPSGDGSEPGNKPKGPVNDDREDDPDQEPQEPQEPED